MSRRRAAVKPGRTRSGRPRAYFLRQWYLLTGGIVLAVLVAVAIASSIGGASSALAAERHALGERDAPVTVLEWADFQ